jgi:dTMP kinase
MARSALAGKGIKMAKEGNTLGPITMTLFYATDFADRLENEIIPALRAGFVVLIDRYIFSIMARAIARGEDRRWIEQAAGFALVPHAVFYLRAEVEDLVSRVVLGRGAFDYWESGMDLRFGPDMYESFVRYQTRLIKALDAMKEPYEFTTIDAGQPAQKIFRELQRRIARLQLSKVRTRGKAR